MDFRKYNSLKYMDIKKLATSMLEKIYRAFSYKSNFKNCRILWTKSKSENETTAVFVEESRPQAQARNKQ